MRSRTSLLPPAAVLAAAAFVAVAIAVTGIVHASGREIADTGRYQGYAEAMKSGLVPYRDFDVEYPPGALLVFALPALAVSRSAAYYWAFAFSMAAVGAIAVLLTAVILRLLGRPPAVRRRVLTLIAISPVVFGGVLLTRFDLVPAAFVAAGTLLLLADRHRSASLALGAAAAVKLYPLVLLPLFASWTWHRFGRRDAVRSSGLTVGVVVLAYLPFLLLAPEGTGSSLWDQVARPLQIESLGAGVLLLLHHAVDLEVAVDTDDGSQNLIGGPTIGVAAAFATASFVALSLLWVGFARDEATPERLVRYGAALLVALVALSKVQSPQFLVWLVLPLALVGARRGAAAGACFAVAAVATAVWFPALYFELPRDRDPFVSMLVVLRGLALVGALALLVSPIGSERRTRVRPHSRGS